MCTYTAARNNTRDSIQDNTAGNTLDSIAGNNTVADNTDCNNLVNILRDTNPHTATRCYNNFPDSTFD